MRHLGLFEGIGGFSLAARWMGWETVAWVEINEFCQEFLRKNFPAAKGYGDIKQFDGTEYTGAVDILTGGFPCQPFSSAGKRKGTKDDRHLWPEMLRVIREVQPSFIVGENVYGLLNWSNGLVFEQVCIDLENEGYQVQPVILPAVGLNAPHRRDRIWFVAYSPSGYDRRAKRKVRQADGRQVGELLPASFGTSSGLRQEGIAPIADSHAIRNNTGKVQSSTETIEGAEQREEWNEVQRERMWPEPSSSDHKHSGNRWKDFPTQSPLLDGDDGIPAGLAERFITAGGNAIVPQIAYEIFKAINLTIDEVPIPPH